jgi:SAM-dependent methyltransferase
MGRRVLELGCGRGEDLRLFAALGAEAVIGVDAFGADLPALSARFRDLPVDLVSHDFRDRVPLWRASADLTLVNRIRLSKPDPEALLREAKRLTVPGGLIHVLAPYPYQSQSEDFGPPIRVSDYFRIADGLGLGFQGIHEAVWGDTPSPDASRAPDAPALLMLVFRVYS